METHWIFKMKENTRNYKYIYIIFNNKYIYINKKLQIL